MADPTPYTPKLPHGLPNVHAGTESPLDAHLGWTPAPATSHVAMFRYFDSRDPRFSLPEGKSQLHVRFRKGKSGGITDVFAYFFSSPDAGQQVYDKMADSPHPYGEGLYPLVIRAGVPYTKL